MFDPNDVDFEHLDQLLATAELTADDIRNLKVMYVYRLLEHPNELASVVKLMTSLNKVDGYLA